MNGLDSIAVRTNFSVLDWGIVIAFLVISTGLGLYARKYIKSMDDYVVAGRSVKTYLGVATIIASEMGLVTAMYSAQKGFKIGFAAFYIAAISALVTLVVGLTGFVVVPLRRSRAMTIPEFYEQRYSRNVRLVGGAILAFSGILNMGMFLKADSLFITSVMGFTSDTQLKLAMTIMLGLVLLYTILGGMVAVLVTDYMQYVVMAIGLVATSVFLMGRYNWHTIITSVQSIKGDAGFDPVQGVGGIYMVWMGFLGLVGAALWQTSVMRAASAENEQVVRRTFSWGSVGFLIRFMIPYFWGICALIYISQTPALKAVLLSKTASSEDTLRAMPLALTALLPAGAIGMLTAGMLAAAMSTYNTYLHCWSSVLTQDVVGPLTGHRLGHRQRILITQGIMFAIGVFLLLWGLWYPLKADLWDYMAVTGAVYFTGAFAVLVGGIYWKRASRVGAFLAFACGWLNVLSLDPVKQALGHPNWNAALIGLISVCATSAALVLGSMLFPDRKKELASA